MSVLEIFIYLAKAASTSLIFFNLRTVIFHFGNSASIAAQRPELRDKRLHTTDLAIPRISEPTLHPNANRVDVHYTVIAQDLTTSAFHSFEEIHPMRHFSLTELDLLAEAAGFERLTAEEWLSGAPPSEATWGVCLVLRKQGAPA